MKEERRWREEHRGAAFAGKGGENLKKQKILCIKDEGREHTIREIARTRGRPTPAEVPRREYKKFVGSLTLRGGVIQRGGGGRESNPN